MNLTIGNVATAGFTVGAAAAFAYKFPTAPLLSSLVIILIAFAVRYHQKKYQPIS